MGSNCSCKYKCGNVDISFSTAAVVKNQQFSITIKPYRKEFSPNTNTTRKVTYLPDRIFMLSASTSVGFSYDQNYSWQEHYNEDGELEYYYAEVSGCCFTGDPPDEKNQVNITVSVNDPTPPCEGACGAATINLNKTSYNPSLVKYCYGVAYEGDGILNQHTPGTWLDGIDVYYYTEEYYIGFVPYNEDKTFGPMNCPVIDDPCSATFVITWS